MDIQKCMLDVKNEFVVGDSGATVGALVASSSSNKKCLWDKRACEHIDTIVIHYMSAVNVSPDDPYNLAQMIKVFCDYGVSCHYLINRDGGVYNLVPEDAKAWHCGGSIMPAPDDRKSVNDFSIGIELAATDTSGFTDAQYKSLRELCGDISTRHTIKNIVGHDEVAGQRAVDLRLRKDVKHDPGAMFDWTKIVDIIGDWLTPR